MMHARSNYFHKPKLLQTNWMHRLTTAGLSSNLL